MSQLGHNSFGPLKRTRRGRRHLAHLLPHAAQPTARMVRHDESLATRVVHLEVGMTLDELLQRGQRSWPPGRPGQAFHPYSTVEVRFVVVCGSLTGEKLFVAGEEHNAGGRWCMRGKDRTGSRPPGAALRGNLAFSRADWASLRQGVPVKRSELVIRPGATRGIHALPD